MRTRVVAVIWHLVRAALPLLMLSGCGKLTLIAEDAVVLDGRATPLNAHVGRQDWFNLHGDGGKATVTFYAGGRAVGQDKVDPQGHAFVVLDDRAGSATSFQALTKARGQNLQGTGRIFRWRSDRVIVAVDVDYCIARTNYVRLLFGRHIPVSPPFDGAREVIQGLSKDYQVLYFTARPRPMLNRTREWLDHYRFPPGPVTVSDHFSNVLHQLEWKRDALKQLQLQYPSLLISVGNRLLDIQSALPNMILPLTIQSAENDTKDDRSTVFLQDWQAMAEFFRINRHVLIDPARLGQAIHAGIGLQQPVRDPAWRYYYVQKCVNCEGNDVAARPQEHPRRSTQARQAGSPVVSRGSPVPPQAWNR